MPRRRAHAAHVRWPVVLATVAAGAVLLALVLVLMQAEREAEAPATAVLAAPRAALVDRGLVASGGAANGAAATQPLPATPELNADGTPVAEGAPVAAAVASDGTVEAAFTGRVVNDAGQPVAGAFVRHVPVSQLRDTLELVADKRTGELRWEQFASTTTDAEGRFTLPTRELPRELPEAVEGEAGEAGEDGAAAGESEEAQVMRMLRGTVFTSHGSIRQASGLGYFGSQNSWNFGGSSDEGDGALPEAPVLVVSHAGYALAALTCKDFRRGECAVGDVTLRPGAVLVGRVTDPDGRVVPGARVGPPHDGWVSTDTGHWELLRQLLRAESGTDGRFHLEGLWAAQYGIEVSHPDFVPTQENPELPEGGTADLGDVRLQPGRTIRGRVLDVDGKPRGGAEVMARPAFLSPENPGLDTLLHEAKSDLSNRGSHEVHTTSAADGTFLLSTLNHDSYSVFADAPDRDPACERDVRAGTQGLQLRLSTAASLLLTVVDGATGAPLRDVEASAIRRSRHDGGGPTQLDPMLDVLVGADALEEVRARREASGIAADPPTVPEPGAAPVADAAHAADAADAADAGAGLILVKRAGALRTDVIVSAPGHATRGFVQPGVPAGEQLERTLKLWTESVIAGRVLDAVGQPIVGAQVSARPPEDLRVPLEGRLETTGADGSFRIGSLVNGEWRVSAFKRGFLAADERPVFVRREQVREGVDIVLQASAVLTGLVLDPDGAPAVEVYVNVSQGEGDDQIAQGCQTNAQGRFRIDTLLPGAAKVQCWPALPVTLALSCAQPIDIVLRLRARPSITGRVLASGQPVPGASVWARGQSRGSTRIEASETGTFELDLWDAGEWVVFAMPAPPARSAATQPVLVTVDWNGRTQVDLVFSGVTVSGRIVDAISGQPVPGASAVLTDRVVPKGSAAPSVPQWKRRPSATAIADAEGRFRIEWAQPGECSLTARGPHSRMVEPLALTVGTEPLADLELALPQGQVLRGTLHTASGEPLPPELQLCLVADGSDKAWYLDFDEDGNWECGFELAAGSYRVRVVQQVGNWFGEDSERELTSASVSLAPGEIRILQLTIDG